MFSWEGEVQVDSHVDSIIILFCMSGVFLVGWGEKKGS